MPTFETLTVAEITDLTTRRTITLVDLSAHKAGIEAAVRNDGWGRIALEPSDTVRTTKRRTTVAGQQLGRVIKWHRKSTPATLLFRAIEPKDVIKRPRKK